MARGEVGTLARLKARRVNTAGESVVADFASAVAAMQCAVAVQAAISTENAVRDAVEPMEFHSGVHVRDE
jgi:adenylate cyclase